VAWRKDAAGMQPLVLRGPFAAQIGLGRPSVGPRPPVKTAGDSIVIQEAAGRDDFGLDREVTRPLYLAEIRRPPGTHQCLQPSFPTGTHDLDLEVAAACCAAGIVGRPAWGQGAGVLRVQYRQASWGRRKRSGHGTAVLHHQEPIPSQPAPLLGLVGPAGCGPPEAMRGALSNGTLTPKVPARDVEGGIHVELPSILPDIGKRDVLRVPNQPGGLMVQ
jgi:hypothetical protein